MKFFLLLLLQVSLFASIGNVIGLKGIAQVQRDEVFSKLSVGSELYELDKISTAIKSRIQIKLQDDTIVTIGEKSEFSFSEYVFDEENSKVLMESKTGFFRSITGRIGKLAPQRFKVKTASATIGIRGTDFVVDSTEEKKEFRCIDGKIVVTTKGKDNTLDAGMMLASVDGKSEVKKFDLEAYKKKLMLEDQEMFGENKVVQKEHIGNIMAMKGSAEVKRADNMLGTSSGMELFEGDEIVTKEKTRVQVMLKDDTVVTIGSNSEFSFEEFSQDGEDSKVSMQAKRGFFRSVTGKIGKLAPERFKVKTASATIGIRGTDFSGEIAEGREVFKCFEGAIFIEFDGNINELDAGMMMEILGTKLEIQEFDASKVDKPSEKMENLKGIVIKSIDNSEIPTEVVSDITQIIESVEDDILPEVVQEPFEMTLIPEDREIQY